MDVHPDIRAVAALEEPARQKLYDYVCQHLDPVSRDDASEALNMPRQTAAFHLDRLAEVGLLTIEFARRSGRMGPGAGRPAKLYRRSADPIAVQLPERSYELAGQLLAQAVDDAESTGVSPRTSLNRRAADLGRTLGAAAGASERALMAALTRCGYEPRRDGADIALVNCPFHALAAQHTDLVCRMNLGLLDGLLQGAGCTARRAVLAPQLQHCCVRLEPVEEPDS